MANTARDTFEMTHGNDRADAKEVPLTSAQKEKINAFVQAVVDETKLPNLGFWQFGFNRVR